MADSTNANNLVQNRVIKSRPNTREERLKQQKAWKKKRRERERARNAVTIPLQDRNADKSSNSASDLSVQMARRGRRKFRVHSNDCNAV